MRNFRNGMPLRRVNGAGLGRARSLLHMAASAVMPWQVAMQIACRTFSEDVAI